MTSTGPNALTGAEFWKRAALIVVGVAVSTGLTRLFPQIFAAAPNALFLAAVLLCAHFGSRRTAYLCALAAVVIGDFLVQPQPAPTLSLPYFVRAAAFLSITALSLYAYEHLLRSRQDVNEHAEWLRVTLTSIGDAVIATDTHGKITLMNPVAEGLTGWSAAESLGQPLEHIFPILDEETGRPVDQPVAKVLREEAVVALGDHTVLVSRQGRRIPIEDSAAPIRSRAGKILGVIVVFHDVTEERARDNALRESEARFRAVADTAPVMIWTVDTAMQCDYLNQPWLDFTGRTLAQELGEGWTDGVQPDDRERCVDIYTSTFASRQPFRMEYRLRRHDGEYRWVQDTGVPRFAPDGTFVGFIGSCIDVTEQKQTLAYTQELQTLTSALSSAVTPDQVADVIVQQGLKAIGGHLAGVATLGADGRTVTYINHIGRSDSLIRSFTIVTLDTPAPMTTAIRTGEAQWIESREAFQAAYANVDEILVDAPQIQSIAAIPLRIEGKVVGGMALAFPRPHLFKEGERAFLLALAEQCALALERARLFQAEQKAREAAEAADRLKLEFLALISHELRTPLASIKGFATTLMAEDVTFDAETQRSFIGIINAESDRLTELIEQLLDLSRLTAGNLRIKPQPTDFETILETAMAQFETLTSDHQLVIHLPPDLPLMLADAPRIAQVLVNLVGNATKFAPAHSQIVLAAASQGDTVRIEVSDRGQGIPLDARAYVFDAFRQVDNNAPAQKGAGLGLAICRGLVQQHGGEIWIEDRDGGGTTFAFTLPVAPSSAEPNSAE